ncbi:hypothetical protein GLOIN_2v1768097 [Rhizophagus irregularis DAOM 181602=DAOM 197198]|nr:hypothetical protein GLOIN_2v1768097 [Rhizophagus irregularis DAOM 181602=DAOM 197198]
MSCSKIFLGELPELTYDILKWTENSIKTLKPEKSYSNDVNNFERLIQMLLFKLFIDNEANLHTFKIEIFHNWNSHCDNILELILQNPNFIHNVKNLNIYTSSYPNNDETSKINESSFQSLLQKCGGYLENFGCEFGVQNKLLLESIIKYCKNIKSLYLNRFRNELIYLLLDLIENLKQSLNYLTIKITGASDNYGYKELVSLKDEVEEFKLYDIKVQCYNGSITGRN